MSYYYKLGRVPHKRHTQFRQPDGSLYHEELMGIHGFTGNKSLLYHLRPPTAISRVEIGRPADPAYATQGPLRHRLLRTLGVPEGGDAVDGRLPLMGNQDVRVSVARPSRAMDYWYRHAHGDEVLFIHEGTGVLQSQFGTLQYGPGDYLVIPTGVLWRMIPDETVAHGHANKGASATAWNPGGIPGKGSVPHRILVIETFGGHIGPPRRYINDHGQLLE